MSADRASVIVLNPIINGGLVRISKGHRWLDFDAKDIEELAAVLPDIDARLRRTREIWGGATTDE